MKVFKVNKWEMTKAIFNISLIIGFLTAGFILENGYLGGVGIGLHLSIMIRFLGLDVKKPAIESFEVKEETIEKG